MAEADQEETRRHSRREKKKSKGSSALEKIRLSRQSGVRQEEELEETDGLFEYVTEDEYTKIIKERQADQFIMDDDGTYREHGRELFDEEVSGKQKSSAPPPKVGSSKGRKDIKDMVLGMGGAKRRRSERKEEASVKKDTVLSSILEQLHKNQAEVKPERQFNRYQAKSDAVINASPSPQSRAPLSQKRRSLTTPTMPFKKVPKVKPRSPSPDPSPGGNDPQWDDADLWNSYEPVEQTKTPERPLPNQQTSVDRNQEPNQPKSSIQTKAAHLPNDDDITSLTGNIDIPDEAVSTSGWETVREGLMEQAPPTSNDQEIDSHTLPMAKTEGGDHILSFYCIDMYEDPYKKPGTVYLFGKVATQPGNYVSCCVTVQNIDRCMYFLPREKMMSSSFMPTDEIVTMQAVYMEFNNKYAEKYHIMRFSSKRVEKKFCFLPDVPHESEYLEVRYSADYPAPPSDASGRSFSRVFGTNTSSLERLIISCQMKGPCWLNITNPVVPAQNISWCKVECTADSLSSVGVASEQAPPPPLTILSLSMKTIQNAQTKNNEILCMGALVHKDVSLDKPPSTPFQSDVCAIRKPSDRHFPLKFQEHMEQQKNIRVEISPNERGLLAFFLAKIAKIDPDIIIGHNLSSQWLDLLQHRLSICKVPQWSRIGRLRRQVIPKGKSTAQFLCCGRLIVDVKVSARELIRARSYDLSELVNTVLGEKYQPWEEDKILDSFGSLDSLSKLVSHTMDEAYYSLRLTHELCVLPLAYQITCIVGNTLGKTLHGGRSERNEYLLLHAFTQKGYIPPDKLERHKALPPAATDEGDEANTTTVSGKKNKSSYLGGLVLDPKVGFYNRLILLLDFNSLYPSIIQEYNICFTTVDHAHCKTDEDIANLQLPGDSIEPGILPSEIRVLVERRRQVKTLLKTATSPEQRQQYDIRQKALKLTANSMYGCLGFSNSRFYAKPLAAAITGQGREILMHTKELATKLGLDVIYGDTDSIMIDSGTRDIDEAESVAQKVKKEVNKLYRLLEIDIDGIFKCMLLLKKKKYAAISLVNKGGIWTEHRELKGLDIVRRDWSDLAKKAGMYILDQILAGTDYDQLIGTIQEYLTNLSTDVKANKTELDDFVITKALTKLPKDYPDKKSLPHVQVALRMVSRNEHVQSGDVIPYIVCEGSESGLSNAQRAFHPKEVIKQSLPIDTNYYLQSQVHAVVSRLCEPIAGLDSSHLAQWLGLDPAQYAKRLNAPLSTVNEAAFVPGGVSLENAEPLKVKCLNKDCYHITELTTDSTTFSCDKCQSPFQLSLLQSTLAYALRHYKSIYYKSALVCEEDHVTRTTPLSLACRSCGRRVKEMYSSGSLYGQFKYFTKLFQDPKHADLRKMIEIQLDTSYNAYTRISLKHIFPKLRE